MFSLKTQNKNVSHVHSHRNRSLKPNALIYKFGFQRVIFVCQQKIRIRINRRKVIIYLLHIKYNQKSIKRMEIKETNNSRCERILLYFCSFERSLIFFSFIFFFFINFMFFMHWSHVLRSKQSKKNEVCM